MTEYTRIFTVDCPHCDSEKVIKKGMRNGYQRYECKDCRRKFNTTGNAFGKWNKAEHIGAAVDMYYSGMSYKQIAELIGRNYNLPEPAKSTIEDWVHEYSDMAETIVSSEVPETSDHWVADEMQLKVGGKRMWNWNVMDFDTRYVLASHLSPYRDEEQAIAVFEKALKANGGVMPRTVTTDGLGSYGIAIALTLPPPHTKHIVAEGIHAEINNNRSERLQGTFRQRTKVMRGLQGRRSGQRYLDGFVIDYNLFRDHHAHDGETPAHVANVKPNLNEWTDLVNTVSAFRAESSAAANRRKAEAQTVTTGKAARGSQGRNYQQNRGRGNSGMKPR